MEEVILVINYRLSLLSNIKIYPIFYISLLELAPKNALIETNLEVKTD